MATDTGGPAYPLKHYTSDIGPDVAGFMAKDACGNQLWVNSGAPGMTLLDYFAVHAPAEAGTSPVDRYAWATDMVAEKRRREADE